MQPFSSRGKIPKQAGITVHADGSCWPNPGPGGWACLIERPGAGVLELRGSERVTTNNRMELTAAIRGLEALDGLPGPVTVRSDSEYVVLGIAEGRAARSRAAGWMKGRKPVKNADLWACLLRLTEERGVRFAHVPGHSGDVWNERCDALAWAERLFATRPGGLQVTVAERLGWIASGDERAAGAARRLLARCGVTAPLPACAL